MLSRFLYWSEADIIDSPHSDLYVTAQIWADSKPLGVSQRTSYKAFQNQRKWNEWLTFPVKYSSLPLNAVLAITVWDISPSDRKENNKGYNVPFGGTTVPIFEPDGLLNTGRQKCRLYRRTAADGMSTNTTPSIEPPDRRRASSNAVAKDERTTDEDDLDRLEKLLKKHDMGEIPRVEWLDQIFYREFERRRQAALLQSQRRVQQRAAAAMAAAPDGADLDISIYDGDYTLHIELPRFNSPIVFCDHEYPAPPISSARQHGPLGTSNILRPPPQVEFGPGINGAGDGPATAMGRIARVYDPEVGQRTNPAESKHRTLVRSPRTIDMDRDQKPSAKYRDELNRIMEYSPTHELSTTEKDLLWKYRQHLTRDKRALTKFVKSVSWHDPIEARQAVQLLPKWSEIDVDDALELLGPTFDNAAVRAYAVDRLKKADDEDLLLYLLQLVQALKFERLPSEEEGIDPQDSSLAKFLIFRATRSFMLGNYLHWYLMTECDDTNPEQRNEHRKLYARVEFEFMTELLKLPDGPEQRKILLRQGELVTVLSKISKDIRFGKEGRDAKVVNLKKYMADSKNDLMTFDPPLPLPLDPAVSIVGCYPEESAVFKSSLFPLLINFKTSDGKRYPIIFKTGDDLRQDQLVIQIITLMDKLLRKENLDLKLTPYRILATSSNAGAVQFVPSSSLQAAYSKHHGSILAYLRSHNPDPKEPYGVRKEAMETYVKSCAGYCVITYILGVGDRHSDNLLITPDGKLIPPFESFKYSSKNAVTDMQLP
jgi:phosphatidylinositol 3-kinase